MPTDEERQRERETKLRFWEKVSPEDKEEMWLNERD